MKEAGCEGAPDWIIEIVSPSNSENVYVRKLKVYNEMGVREYWIVDPEKERVFVYDFTNKYVNPTVYTFKDKIKVGIYDDLYIDFGNI